MTGRVLDEAGQPIAGARVARGSDLRGNEATGEATTDAAGQFSMPGVPPGALILTVQAHGHAPELKSLTAGPGPPPVEFRLGPGHTIRGRIVDAHDKPIAGHRSVPTSGAGTIPCDGIPAPTPTADSAGTTRRRTS